MLQSVARITAPYTKENQVKPPRNTRRLAAPVPGAKTKTQKPNFRPHTVKPVCKLRVD